MLPSPAYERIAVITDTHANLPALDAALAAIGRAGCDAIYHTGDAIGIGPYPAECLDRLLRTPGIRLLMGNHDAWFAEGLPSPRPGWLSDDELRHQEWTHAQLDPALRATVAGWPYRAQARCGDTPITFTHYGLDDSGRAFAPIVRDPTVADLDRLFPNDGSAIVCYGHHHPASDRRGRARYLNPGALGCSTTPLARFAILQANSAGGCTVQHDTASYDAGPLFRAFEERDVPGRASILRAFFWR